MESARCKAFIESVERGSFRAAADALGYTPSAVSQLVAALERELGLTLLVRSKKGVTMTSEGAKLPLDLPQKVEFGIAYTSKEHMTSAAKKFYDYAVKYIKEI